MNCIEINELYLLNFLEYNEYILDISKSYWKDSNIEYKDY